MSLTLAALPCPTRHQVAPTPPGTAHQVTSNGALRPPPLLLRGWERPQVGEATWRDREADTRVRSRVRSGSSGLSQEGQTEAPSFLHS